MNNTASQATSPQKGNDTANPVNITKFNFTYAMDGGAWIERANGQRDWMSFAMLAKEKGQAWIDAMLKKQGWMTGCWIDCESNEPSPLRAADNPHTLLTLA